MYDYYVRTCSNMLTMLHFLYSKPSNSSKRYCASILVTLKARIETFELQYAAETSGTAGEAPIVRGRFASWHGRHHDDLEKASARRLGKSTAAASAACRSLLCVHPGDIMVSFLLIPSLNVSSFRTSLTIVTGHKGFTFFSVWLTNSLWPGARAKAVAVAPSAPSIGWAQHCPHSSLAVAFWPPRQIEVKNTSACHIQAVQTHQHHRASSNIIVANILKHPQWSTSLPSSIAHLIGLRTLKQ